MSAAQRTAAAKNAVDDAQAVLVTSSNAVRNNLPGLLNQVTALTNAGRDTTSQKQQAIQLVEAKRAANISLLRAQEVYLQAQLREMEARRLTLTQTWAQGMVDQTELTTLNARISAKQQAIATANSSFRTESGKRRAKLPWER